MPPFFISPARMTMFFPLAALGPLVGPSHALTLEAYLSTTALASAMESAIAGMLSITATVATVACNKVLRFMLTPPFCLLWNAGEPASSFGCGWDPPHSSALALGITCNADGNQQGHAVDQRFDE